MKNDKEKQKETKETKFDKKAFQLFYFVFIYLRDSNEQRMCVLHLEFINEVCVCVFVLLNVFIFYLRVDVSAK